MITIAQISIRNSSLGWIPHTISSKPLCGNTPRGFFWRGRIAPSGTLSHRSLSFKTVGLQYMRPHHTFLRPKLLKNSATGDTIGSHGWCSSFQAMLHVGLHPPTPWGHAGGLVWVESSKQSGGTRLNCVFCSFRGPYSTHCKSCEKTSFGPIFLHCDAEHVW